MKFEVDTNRKILRLEGNVTFDEIESLKKFIGKGWEKWTIEGFVITNTIYRDNWRTVPFYRPYYETPFTWCDTTKDATIDHQSFTSGDGIYFIETSNIKELASHSSIQ